MRRNSDNANPSSVSFSEKYFGIKSPSSNFVNNNNSNFILNLNTNNNNNGNSSSNSTSHSHSHHALSQAPKPTTTTHMHQRQQRGSLVPTPKKVQHHHSHSNAHLLFPSQLSAQRSQNQESSSRIAISQSKDSKKQNSNSEKRKEKKNKDKSSSIDQSDQQKSNQQQQQEEVKPPPLRIEPLRSIVDVFVSKMNDEQISTWAEEALKWIIGCSDIQLATTSLVIFNRLKQKKSQNVIQAIIRTVYYHLNQNSDSQCSELRLLSQLVAESFIMLQEYFEDNEVLLFDYVFSFLDCRLFVESSLFEAKELLFNCMSVERVRTKMIANKISIIRPLIPRLETSKDAQKIFDQMIKTIPENVEMQIIIAPLKSADPSLFPSAMDVNVIFARSDDSTLCKALSHYAFMLKTSSRTVLNEIFRLSAEILSQIQQNENNRISLSKIYQSALHYMTQCPNATNFITVLCGTEPAAATLGVIDLFEWDRSIDDVRRNVKTIMKNDDSPIVTITDCKCYTAVTRFLQPDCMPKILPFAAQREMIEGMKRVIRDQKSQQKSTSYRRSPTMYATYAAYNPKQTTRTTSEYFDEFLGNDLQEMEYQFTPLNHPKKLIMKPINLNPNYGQETVNADDFVTGIKRSNSLVLTEI